MEAVDKKLIHGIKFNTVLNSTVFIFDTVNLLVLKPSQFFIRLREIINDLLCRPSYFRYTINYHVIGLLIDSIVEIFVNLKMLVIVMDDLNV